MKPWRVLSLLLTLVAAAWAQPKNPNDIVLEQTLLPEISFKEASLSSVLEYLSQKAGDKSPLNFVTLYPAEYGEKLITLQLTHVPLKVVLDYIGAIAGVDFIPDPHAIRVIATPPKPDTQP